ncbi:ankyrin repeat domain-containing protein [Andreprevotia chitinilytica]|uniref:ankyrin repeat domain-containing protein n=1 Tax=Andreprevotia chitinilytica TaxID=396808 RepID=UPI000689CF7B|nr:ankyrin repeat domain-containing protein [Andreprevotia chitinilytica]
MSSSLRAILEQANLEDRFPERLAAQFPRITEKIAEMWGQDALASYFEDLLIMDRPDRQGFPPEIGMELMLLSIAYDVWRHKPAEVEDVWSHERIQAQDVLEAMGLKPTVREFHRSVSSGDDAVISLYMKAGMTLESEDELGWTALLRFAFDGNHTMVGQVLQRGANPLAHDRDGYSSLHWAALNGHDQVVKVLIEQHASVNATSRNGFTPLIQAASRGHIGIVQRLISAGAHVNQATDDGWTALHKAIANGHVETAIKLLDLDADPLVPYRDGTTPLQMAVDREMHRLREVIQLTLKLRQRRESATVSEPGAHDSPGLKPQR